MKSKTFVLIYFLFLSIGILFTVGLTQVLSKYFEHNSYEEIVQHQIRHNSIYGSALNENYFAYRLALIKQVKPEIIAIGSSRVGQFRQKFFSRSFVAAANASNSLEEMQQFITKILKLYRPKPMILGVDPWWFNKKIPNTSNATYQSLQGKEISPSKIFNSVKIFSQHPELFKHLLSSNLTTHNPYTTLDSLGFRAIIKSDGSLSDGSYLYFSTLSGIAPANDRQFLDSKYRIKNEIFPFYYGEKLDPKRIKLFEHIMEFLKQNQFHFIVLTTPFAPTIYNILIHDDLNRYQYINDFASFARDNKIFNFLNPNKIKLSDCEFYDGFHGGDIAYSKILNAIARSSSDLRSFLNLSVIKTTLQTRAGYVYSDNIDGWNEVDFLELGCKR
ncbi:hypothetical protein [Helicobacter kayseriensis]|uniref:hypothetical protein n=1 Tax=Helicobacter kayseriensis TaxID=2905877 RepID=UPI001E3E8A8A|nr:hypothetical protein [Helicobacter kayseriensis]MCE3046642.1 hypothetical protein [Helicobacter kayseriensis]